MTTPAEIISEGREQGCGPHHTYRGTPVDCEEYEGLVRAQAAHRGEIEDVARAMGWRDPEFVAEIIEERDHLERERAEDRAAIRALKSGLTVSQIVSVIVQCRLNGDSEIVTADKINVLHRETMNEQYAAAIARATGQEGAKK